MTSGKGHLQSKPVWFPPAVFAKTEILEGRRSLLETGKGLPGGIFCRLKDDVFQALVPGLPT